MKQRKCSLWKLVLNCRISLVLLLFSVVFFLTACSSSSSNKPEEEADWAIYWYLCGSDLESKHGAASADLEEMLKAELPEGVKAVIETGGAAEWTNRKIKADENARFIYDKKGLKKLDTMEVSNMGDSQTLADFLSYCHEIHPAEHSMLILWNHGGGALGGVAYDEIYGLDSLSLTELQTAFQTAFPNCSEPCFDIIGFDACLMANIDTAQAISPYADYMIASQELEPGNGWNYTGILTSIAENPGISPMELGIDVCDSFMSGCEEYGSDAEATLSMIDLSKAKVLFDEFCSYGDSLFLKSLEDEALFASLGRAANQAEGYGANNKEEGYTNMVDLGGILKSDTAIPNSEVLTNALEECVLYQVKGDYRAYGNGLSCYYPFDHALSNLFQYKENSSFYGYQNLFQYQISGKLGTSLLEYLETENLNFDKERQPITISQLGLDNYPVTVSPEGEMILDIGNRADYLKQVSGYLAWIDMDAAQMIGIGNEVVEDAEWEKGIFSYPYRTEWLYLNDHLIYTYCVEDQEEYNLYAAPLMLNGERVFLRIAENSDGRIEILGARRELGENGMPDKQLIQLKEGDKVATLFYQSGIGADNFNLDLKEYEEFLIGEKTEVTRQNLKNGIYVWTYDMNDMWNDFATSELTMYELTDGIATGM